MIKKLPYFSLIVLLLGGCGSNRIPFTQKLRNQYLLTADELHRLQYYVSEQAVLRRLKREPNSREVRDGKLYTRSEQMLDDVIIKKNTPGILVGEEDEQKRELQISFEEGSSFPFRTYRSERYTLRARDSLSRRAPLTYKGMEYTLLNEGDDIHLVISKESLDKLIKKRKVLPGRRVE